MSRYVKCNCFLSYHSLRQKYFTFYHVNHKVLRHLLNTEKFQVTQFSSKPQILRTPSMASTLYLELDQYSDTPEYCNIFS